MEEVDITPSVLKLQSLRLQQIMQLVQFPCILTRPFFIPASVISFNKLSKFQQTSIINIIKYLAVRNYQFKHATFKIYNGQVNLENIIVVPNKQNFVVKIDNQIVFTKHSNVPCSQSLIPIITSLSQINQFISNKQYTILFNSRIVQITEFINQIDLQSQIQLIKASDDMIGLKFPLVMADDHLFDEDTANQLLVLNGVRKTLQDDSQQYIIDLDEPFVSEYVSMFNSVIQKCEQNQLSVSLFQKIKQLLFISSQIVNNADMTCLRRGSLYLAPNYTIEELVKIVQ